MRARVLSVRILPLIVGAGLSLSASIPAAATQGLEYRGASGRADGSLSLTAGLEDSDGVGRSFALGGAGGYRWQTCSLFGRRR